MQVAFGMFQYFNCIGGIILLIVETKKEVFVSILQLYRWNFLTFKLCSIFSQLSFNTSTVSVEFFASKQGTTRPIIVSILQLYRWNVYLKAGNTFLTSVSILQLYRWNIFLQLLVENISLFQYFNCIGGMVKETVF